MMTNNSNNITTSIILTSFTESYVLYFLVVLKYLLHFRQMFTLYALLLRSLATLRSLHFFSEAGTSGGGAEAQAVDELPV